MQLFAPSHTDEAASLLLASPLAAQDAVVDPAVATANAALEAAPVFDGHNDVPNQLRSRRANQINDFDFEDTTNSGEGHPEGRALHTGSGPSGRRQGRGAILVGLRPFQS